MSNKLPGRLAVDRCKFRINPNGSDVTISLTSADGHEPWHGMTRVEFERP